MIIECITSHHNKQTDCDALHEKMGGVNFCSTRHRWCFCCVCVERERESEEKYCVWMPTILIDNVLIWLKEFHYIKPTNSVQIGRANGQGRTFYGIVSIVMQCHVWVDNQKLHMSILFVTEKIKREWILIRLELSKTNTLKRNTN